MSRKLTVAIDFGTTFSKVAYLDSSHTDREPTLIKRWSARSGEMIPTLVHYGAGSSVDWGFGAASKDKGQIGWFKLGLDQDAIERYNHISADFNNEFLPNLLSFPNVDDATTYTTDFLTELKKDVMVQLRKIFKHSPDVKIKWVLTVPAVWDLAARQLTERCAERAGFPKPTLVLEPVGGLAHALMPYALPESLKDQGFKDGSQIVVLDAGGGTVDLISYELITVEPPTVREVVGGRGGKCGSLFINKHLENAIMTRIGAGLKQLNPRAVAAMRRDIDYAKASFTGAADDTQSWGVSVPGVVADEVEDGMLLLSYEEMLAAHDTVINKAVVPLLWEQINDTEAALGPGQHVRYVLLMGGFGASHYLWNRLSEVLGSRSPPIEVICPTDLTTAVVLGAAARVPTVSGSKDMESSGSMPAHMRVVSQKAPANFGTKCNDIFIEGVHDPSTKYYDAIDGIDRSRNCMSWIVSKDLDCTSEPNGMDYYQHVKVGRSLKLDLEMFYSYYDIDPNAAYYFDKECVSSIKLTMDFRPEEKTLPIVQDDDGKKFYKIRYRVLIYLKEATVMYKWYFNDKIFAMKAVRYPSNPNV